MCAEQRSYTSHFVQCRINELFLNSRGVAAYVGTCVCVRLLVWRWLVRPWIRVLISHPSAFCFLTLKPQWVNWCVEKFKHKNGFLQPFTANLFLSVFSRARRFLRVHHRVSDRPDVEFRGVHLRGAGTVGPGHREPDLRQPAVLREHQEQGRVAGGRCWSWQARNGIGD